MTLHDEMVEALLQYRDDLRRPPEGESCERRLERVETIIAKLAHTHVAGTTVGLDIDTCARCHRDLRNPIHSEVSS